MSGSSMAGMIHIKSFAYSGLDRVPAGAEVTVMNMDSEAHHRHRGRRIFWCRGQSGTIVTFPPPKNPGVYPYRCNMHGTPTVK
jgi:plastocyanin